MYIISNYELNGIIKKRDIIIQTLSSSRMKGDQMNIKNFIGATQQDFSQEELINLLRTPEWIIENSLYMDNRGNKCFCSYNGKVLKLSCRLFKALYLLAKEPDKSHYIDEYSYNNERQIIRRIFKVFRNADFTEKIITKIRGLEGYRINTSVIPEMFIITK